ncbi:hypothetical protein DVH24_011085 [Malus domestica]|uniref:Sey1/RHD3-like three-helix bundle domain-containing protein n=1 Tax=Malus domestica TaxID=3750 RepID=A0A498JTH2_MALDO|nr:hypothetical protein DVH24_011085 [Malus domestica]
MAFSILFLQEGLLAIEGLLSLRQDFPLIWKVIKENKDLDLPAHKVMVATVRCEEIANQKFKQLVHDEKKLSSSLSGPVEALLETGAKDTWASIRKLLNRETKVAVSEFSTAFLSWTMKRLSK